MAPISGADHQWTEWYLLTPAQRFEESQRLWTNFWLLGGTSDPEPDSQSPFYFPPEAGSGAPNLNAAYELGVRHALKPNATIVIAEEQFAPPFDVNHIVIRKYRHDGKNVQASVSEPADAIADFVLARRTRADVFEICKKRLESLKDSEANREERQWILATMAEAALGTGDEALSTQNLALAATGAPEAWIPDSTNEQQLAKLRHYLSDSPLKHLPA